MKVFMLKDVQRVGMKGEIVEVSSGYARNYILPNNLGIEVTPQNQANLENKVKTIENRKNVIASKSSMLAEKIKSIKLTMPKKLHDNDKLYGAISANEIVDLLAKEGVNINKSQVEFDKSIKSKGVHEVIIKLTSSLKPKLKLKVIAEK